MGEVINIDVPMLSSCFAGCLKKWVEEWPSLLANNIYTSGSSLAYSIGKRPETILMLGVSVLFLFEYLYKSINLHTSTIFYSVPSAGISNERTYFVVLGKGSLLFAEAIGRKFIVALKLRRYSNFAMYLVKQIKALT
ncbi:Ubiquitin carboxyl-terminal hydrolase 26 [Gossypium arboreum]|uniref:Uncharacterized protein n=2 Tax=Gossypium arboreum TaxID=29729 RepID=A0ABR0P123_GOSAR|nr:hypothetical protein PVK06_027238 [Gossypium arboreum]KHF97283.1 Ubiquitin carboxyl-terminal hydrolase 26 [Gossypium arboreum]